MNRKKLELEIKKFIFLCKHDRFELKDFLKSSLENYFDKESIHDRNSFLYAEGTEPYLLVAHLDTVHKAKPLGVNVNEHITPNGDTFNIISAPNGIGGDDRCGVYMILNILKSCNCSVLFMLEEESCNARYLDRPSSAVDFFNSDDIENFRDKFNYIIELDRRGGNDAVFYECGNQSFKDFVQRAGFIENNGSYTDICEFSQKLNVASVNLSCGYYNEHNPNEYVVFEEMQSVIERAINMLSIKSEKFDYQWNGNYNPYVYYDQGML